MKESVVVLGAGGHAKVVIEILRASGYQVDFCVGGEDSSQFCMGVPVLRGDQHLLQLRDQGYVMLFPAIGSNAIRQRVTAFAQSLGFTLINAISSRAVVSPSAVLGIGISIMSGAVINAESSIGDLTIINTGATVDHECQIGFCSHVAPQCALAGNVTVGRHVFLGIGTVVIPDVTIGDNATTGSGSVVISNIAAATHAHGNPAKILKLRSE